MSSSPPSPSMFPSPPILIPIIKKVNIPMTPCEYFKSWREDYIYEKYIKYKYHGMTYYRDEFDDDNNIYSDDEHYDVSASHLGKNYDFLCDPMTDEHPEDDDFTLTTFG